MVRLVGVEGVVEDFSLRRTTLRDLDGTLHVVPNGQIIVTSNLARLWAYVSLDIGVAPDADLDRASEVVGEVGDELKADPEWGSRLLAPPQVVRIGASPGTVRVQVQVRAADQQAFGDELRERVLAAFDRAGIEVPTRIGSWSVGMARGEPGSRAARPTLPRAPLGPDGAARPPAAARLGVLALGQQHRRLAVVDRVAGDDDLLHVGALGDVVHHLEQHLLDDRAQGAGAGLALERAGARSPPAPRP